MVENVIILVLKLYFVITWSLIGGSNIRLTHIRDRTGSGSVPGITQESDP